MSPDLFLNLYSLLSVFIALPPENDTNSKTSICDHENKTFRQLNIGGPQLSWCFRFYLFIS